MKEAMDIIQINFEGVKLAVTVLGTVVLTGAIKTSVDYKLCKRSNAEYTRINRLPENVTMEAVSNRLNKCGIKKEASITINEFLKFLREKGFNTDYFFRNFKPNFLEEKAFDSRGSQGRYDFANGKLIVNKNNFEESLQRSLIELASTCQFDTFTAHGFERINYGINTDNEENRIGKGFNRVYTELLMSRYFEGETHFRELTDIMLLIEQIVGRDKMEKLYFRGDLGSLVPIIGDSCIRKFDYLFTVLYENKNIIIKKMSEELYRSLFVSVATQLIEEAELINEGFMSDRKEDIGACGMIAELNMSLSSRDRAKKFKLKDSDYMAIKDCVTESCLPNYYRIYMPYPLTYAINASKRI